jgi:ATP-dependent Lon protease
MNLYDDNPLTDLDKKFHTTLGDKVVIKSLAAQASFAGLPRYVSEYLIAKYVKAENWKADLASVQAKIKSLMPSLDDREAMQAKLLRTGEALFIDTIDVDIDMKKRLALGRLSVLNDKVRVSDALVEQYPGLLGGLWGTAKVRYSPESDKNYPNSLESFTPFQIGPPDLNEFKAHRAKFSTDEWLALMFQSAGYSPAAFPERRTKLLLLSRLLPLVERNVNFLELGPRQTGKTFLLRNVSPRTFVVSGGKATPANLFVNLANKQVGILGTRKVVVFDEIAHTTFDDTAMISILKDYMESGQFSRGSLSFATDCGLVFAGNIDVEDGQPHSKYRHLLEPLPAELIDSAFHDRIHGYLPGWEIPKITPNAIAKGVGFVTDYYGEVLTRLREESYGDLIRTIPLQPGATKRDHTAVERLGSGLLKLLYPHAVLTDVELKEVVTLACELRQRVHNQLVRLAPGEFKPKLIAPEGMTAHAAPDLNKK